MILIEHGDIFTDDADVLVCPVNCVGVLGKGLALEFKRRFPEACEMYRLYCGLRAFAPGDFHAYGRVGFAVTKKHWRDPSQIEWIGEICTELHRYHDEGKFTSIAIPALGCGCGELRWSDVLPIMQRHFASIDARVYAPREAR